MSSIRVEYQLIEDAMQTALLARRLESPRVEVDGRFERASRLAEERGTKQQQLRCSYNKAWTEFWWYEDFSSFIRTYETVQALAQGSSQVTDLELVDNLWQLLYISQKDNQIKPAEARLEERTALLRRELERLRAEQGRPSTVLHARAKLLLMDFYESSDKKAAFKTILREFQQILEQNRGLIDERKSRAVSGRQN
jgi:hypothetical protein